jgi:hypothetical protein
LFWAGLAALGCARSAGPRASAAAAGSPEFDQHWATLAQNEVDVFYIEDDRGEGLMGNVRRARRGNNDALNAKVDDPAVVPPVPSQEAVQRVDVRPSEAGPRGRFVGDLGEVGGRAADEALRVRPRRLKTAGQLHGAQKGFRCSLRHHRQILPFTSGRCQSSMPLPSRQSADTSVIESNWWGKLLKSWMVARARANVTFASTSGN